MCDYVRTFPFLCCLLKFHLILNVELIREKPWIFVVYKFDFSACRDEKLNSIRAQHIWSRLNSYVLRHKHIINDYAGTSLRRSVASGYIYVFLAPKITIKLFHFVDIYFSGAGAAYPSGAHESPPPVFSGVWVTRSLVLRVCFVYRCLFFCPFSFGQCVVCPSSIFWFWLPLQTFLQGNCFITT